MRKYFVTSDTHSYFYIMKNALEKEGFEEDNPEHFLILCGDLFDRGPESKEILQFVQSLKDRFIYIRGNHENLLEECVRDISVGRDIRFHHFTNGTISTIAQLCDVKEEEFQRVVRPDSLNQTVWIKMKPILDWIDNRAIDYYELDDFIFVHGWIPVDFEYRPYNVIPKEEWKDGELWKKACWVNGMEAWKYGAVVPNKTIVCGHWHCSYGWSHIRQERKEFPDKNKKNWQQSFEVFIDEGIIALDACTAYSGLCNVAVLFMGDDNTTVKEIGFSVIRAQD